MSNHRTSPLVLRSFAAALRDNPGKWMKLPTSRTDHKTHAGAINSGHRSLFPPTHYEATARADGVYLRYTEPTSPDTPDMGELLSSIRNLTHAVNRLTELFGD